MPPKFAWPFKKIVDEQDQSQYLGYDQDQQLPPPKRKQSNIRLPVPIPPTAEIKPRPQNPTRSQSQIRPQRIPWTQLTLRSIALLASISSLTIAIYVAIRPGGKVWPSIFVSSITPILLNTAEILAILRSRIHAIKIPRLHPIALIVADLLVVCLLLWSFLVLALDVWIPRRGEGKRADSFDVEMWSAVGIGFIHVLLFVFDCIDCCSARSPNSRVNELSYRRKRMGTSRIGEDVFEMDWG